MIAIGRIQAEKAKRKLSEYQIVKNAALFSSDMPDEYEFLKNAYSGTGGFKDGAYIVPHPREPLEKYLRRCFMSYYCNYMKPCVDAHVNPIFKEYPVREYASSQLADAFLLNIDGKGTNIDRFMKHAALKSKLFGCVFGVVENFAQHEGNLADAIQKRKYPYVYLVNRNQVKDWVVDQFGNLVMIRYELRYAEFTDGQKINKTVTWTWTKDRYTREDENGKSEGENIIGHLPVVPLFGALRDEEDELIPQSEFYAIAKVNLAIFNACSELRERNRNQAFSLLTYPIGEEDDYEDVNEIAIGTTDMLLYRGSAHGKPEYTSPDSAPSTMLLDEIKNMVQEIYRMADRANVTGVQEQSSGVAKEWDHQSMNQSIADFAKNLEEFEEKIMMLFGLYISKDLKYNAAYNKDYGVVDISAELDKATRALMLGVGGKFDTEVKKIAARTMLHDQDDAVVNAVIEDIEQQGADILFGKVEAGGNE